MGFDRERMRIIPTACGGGFGGKLDLSVQPLIALAAWKLDRPVRCIYTRPESMRARPSAIRLEDPRAGACDAKGKLMAVDFDGDFNTGAYASWGPTVANRVPVHATGPYVVPHVRAATRAIYTNNPPAGAFRGFGVPQAAIAHEALMDELADRLGIDRLEFRHLNAMRAGDDDGDRPAPGGERRAARNAWRRCGRTGEGAGRGRSGQPEARPRSSAASASPACGTASAIPRCRTPRPCASASAADGRLTLYNGAVDIGQGSNTIMTQIAADALGVPVEAFHIVMGDTDRTLDAGKTSASRQTFVSGNAAEAAAEDLRRKLLRLANVGAEGARSRSAMAR